MNSSMHTPSVISFKCFIKKMSLGGTRMESWQTDTGRKKKIGSNHILIMEGFNTMHSYFLRVTARDVISFVTNNSSNDPRQI